MSDSLTVTDLDKQTHQVCEVQYSRRYSRKELRIHVWRVCVYLHDVHLHSSPVEFVQSLENSWIKKHSKKSSLWSLCIFVLIVILVSQNVKRSFNIVFCTYWTCSPDGQCRWGSHQSQFRSSRQQTSAPPAAGAGCSVACLHWRKSSSYLWNFDVQIKKI